MKVVFEGFKKFGASFEKPVVAGWLGRVRGRAQQFFAAGMLGRHTGRIYRRRGGRRHQASVNKDGAEYPANDSGRLLASLKSQQTSSSATIGTNVHYARYLRDGTRDGKLKRRKMSDHAISEATASERDSLKGWVKWKRGRISSRGL